MNCGRTTFDHRPDNKTRTIPYDLFVTLPISKKTHITNCAILSHMSRRPHIFHTHKHIPAQLSDCICGGVLWCRLTINNLAQQHDSTRAGGLSILMRDMQRTPQPRGNFSQHLSWHHNFYERCRWFFFLRCIRFYLEFMVICCTAAAHTKNLDSHPHMRIISFGVLTTTYICVYIMHVGPTRCCAWWWWWWCRWCTLIIRRATVAIWQLTVACARRESSSSASFWCHFNSWFSFIKVFDRVLKCVYMNVYV